jgi:hypothetical protein
MFLVTLKTALDTVMTTKDLADRLTGAWLVEHLDLLGEVQTKTAARLLADARDLQGEDRRLMLILALSQLEAA